MTIRCYRCDYFLTEAMKYFPTAFNRNYDKLRDMLFVTILPHSGTCRPRIVKFYQSFTQIMFYTLGVRNPDGDFHLNATIIMVLHKLQGPNYP